MKSITTLILLCAMCVGCGEKVDDKTRNSIKTGTRVIVVDSCEYIQSDVYAGYSITHKGNCSNPIHNRHD